MIREIVLGLSILFLVEVKCEYPFLDFKEFDDTLVIPAGRAAEEVYRLPESVIPLDYDIYIDLYFDERTDKPYSFEGREYITVRAAQENVSEIVLHANVESINEVTVTSDSGSLILLRPFIPYSVEPQYHFLKIHLAEPLEVEQNYTIYIDYSNSMNEGPMKRGIWRGWYKNANGEESIYAATHFQPYNARQAFPCWDEPFFKSTFTLHLSRPASHSAVFSNTNLDSLETISNGTNPRVRNNYLTTPRMSSYLVTFLVSESFQVIAEDTSFTPPIRIIGRSNTVGLGDHALELAVKMTEFFDEYFEYPYSTLSQNLLNDHISSPDWASAGTENWGMVSYRELYMIIDPRETIMSVEHYAATLVSHELAHKWFGNLITCFWWSNTWINEGFASYFGYIATNNMFPKYELDLHFNDRYLQTSLATDSATGTVPLNYDVNTPAQVTAHFGTISYSKGAAFLRMTRDIITLETFRKACQLFLRDNAFEPTNQDDLLKAFQDAITADNALGLEQFMDFNFEEYYRIWVNEPGFPILEVTVDHETGKINLKQERFFLSASAVPTGQIYPIPITYSTNSQRNFNELRPIRIMSEGTMELEKTPGEEWVIFNNQQHGHYRVTYDDRTWELIGEALLNDPESIHFLNRAQVADDVFALMRSERMSYDFGFNILRFLQHEDSYYVWSSAINGFNWLRNRLRHIPEKQAEFDSFILSQMEYAIERLGFEPAADETPTTSLARESILHFACLLGHEQCVQESKDRFAALRNNVWVDPRIRRNVYVVGIREGDEQDFNFLLNRFENSNFANDQIEMLRALGAARDPALITRYLELTLTKEVRTHDKGNSFNYALLGNKENAETALEFIKNRINDIRVAYIEDAPANPVHTVMSNIAAYLDEPKLVEYEDWLRSTQTNTAQFNTAISGIASARSNMAWGTTHADILLAAARGDATKILTSTITMFLMAVLAINI